MATILEQPLSALRLVKGLAVHFGPPQLHSVGKVPQLALCMHITKLKKASEVYDEMTCLQAARDVVIVLQNLGLNYLEPTNYVLSPKSRIEWSAYNPDGRPNSMAVYCSENLHILSLDRSWDLKIASFTQLRAALLENQIPTREEIVSWLPSAAASFLLLLQYSLRAQVWGSHQRRHLLRLIQQVAVEHHPIPSVFELGGITADQHPFAGGGYADVYRALLPNKQPVCLKVLRVYFDLDNNGQDSQAKRTVIRAFFSEAVIWQQLTHPNVLPFLGVCYDAFPNRVCFVSPLMQHGDIMSFLKREFCTFEVRMAMLHGISTGIQYLHEMDICHGDIKGANVLIDNNRQPRIADLGIASIVTSQSETLQVMTTTSHGFRGSLRWAPPEAILPTQYPQPHSTTTRDIYAFGCTMLEVLTGLPPFSHVIQESAIIFLVVDGHRPSKPPIEVVSEDAWRLIERCWCQKPSERFTIDEVINTFHKLINIEPSVKLETPGGAQILSHLVGSSNMNYTSQKLQTSAKPYLEPPPTETDLVLFTDTPPPYQSRASNSPITDRLIPETSGKYESFLSLVTGLGGELGSLRGKELASLIVPIPRGSVVVQKIHQSDNLPLEPSIYETSTTNSESLEYSDLSESKASGQSWISAYVNDLQNLEIILTFSSFSTAGAGAGKVASMATYPFDVIKTQLQAQRAIPGRAGYQGVYDTISSLAQQSGFRGFYRGLGPTILAYWPTWAIYFSVYDGIKNSFESSRSGPPDLESRPEVHPLTLHILASMTAGGVSTLFTNPLWVIKTRFMVQHASEVRYKHTLDAATTIYRTEGFAAFYSGLTPNLLGVAHVAIQYPLYQQLKIWTCDNRDEPITSRTILFCSAVSKIPASIALYPTEVVRTRLQTQKRLLGYENGPRVGLLNFTRTLVRQEGWSSLYRGLSVNIARTLPNSAITMLTYERALRWLSKDI